LGRSAPRRVPLPAAGMITENVFMGVADGIMSPGFHTAGCALRRDVGRNCASQRRAPKTTQAKHTLRPRMSKNTYRNQRISIASP
jgi:hypothetical protein